MTPHDSSAGVSLRLAASSHPSSPESSSPSQPQPSVEPAAGGPALGLSTLGTSLTSLVVNSPPTEEKRFAAMRRGVLHTARAIEEAIEEGGQRFKKAFVTLTYRPGETWAPEHVSQTLACYVEWARRRGFKLLYVWVMELTKAGVPHYHVLLWLPFGFTPPLPDKQGWWKHGMTQAKWVRSPLGYMVKYLSKGLSGQSYPKNARIWGSGGLSVRQRLRRAWYRAPAWLKRFAPTGEVCRVRRCDGGWWNMSTGFWYRSPWWLEGFDRFGPVLRWVGWQADDIEFRGGVPC